MTGPGDDLRELAVALTIVVAVFVLGLCIGAAAMWLSHQPFQ